MPHIDGTNLSLTHRQIVSILRTCTKDKSVVQKHGPFLDIRMTGGLRITGVCTMAAGHAYAAIGNSAASERMPDGFLDWRTLRMSQRGRWK